MTAAAEAADQSSSDPSITRASPINLLTLQFACPQLERAYLRHWCSKQVHFDKVGCYVSMLQLFAGIVYCIAKSLPTPLQGVILMAGSGIVHALHMALLYSSDSYAQHRNTIILVLLAVFRALTAATIPHTPAHYSPSTRLLYKTGIIPLCWYSISLPLPFRYQVLTQLAAVLLYQANLTLPACEDLCSEPRMLGLLEGVWNGMKAGLSITLQTQGIQLSRQPLPAAAAAAANSPLLVCWSSLAFLLLLTGLVLPTPVLYCLELRSRGRFYKQALKQQQQLLALASSRSTSSSVSGSGSSGGSSSRSSSRGSLTGVLAAAGSSGQQQQQTPQTCAAAAASGHGGGDGLAVVPAPQQVEAAAVDGDDLDVDSTFAVPVVSVLLATAVACASTLLFVLSYSPALLQLQLQSYKGV